MVTKSVTKSTISDWFTDQLCLRRGIHLLKKSVTKWKISDWFSDRLSRLKYFFYLENRSLIPHLVTDLVTDYIWKEKNPFIKEIGK